MQPIYEFGGAGQVIYTALANGFPPQTYAPLVKPFTDQYRVISLLPRALWPGEKPPDVLHDWHVVADDISDALVQHDLRDVIAIGHSMGGIASILAAIAHPERFRALILLDPTIFSASATGYMEQIQADGSIRDFPLVQGALRRKRNWADAKEAYTYFKGKSLFAPWPDETVRLYAESGTKLTDGGGVELAFPPEWEAYYFSTFYTKTWDELPKLKLPLLVIRGGDSDTFQAESAEELRALVPQAAYAEIPGHGHMFPQSAPDATRQVIADWLATL
ncbi:MAG: alpha/beta hydrolase [Chloroflexota bacterium]